MTQGKNPRDILIAPVVSEKSYGLLDEAKYTFIVDPQGKTRRTKFGLGKRKDTKRAIVTLREGTIDIFGSAGA